MMARSIAERADVLPQLAEVFRAHGDEGATLALISDATGLGKGSLYNFFPGGKEQMAMEVLDSIDRWFVDNIYTPLRTSTDPAKGIVDMFVAVDDYFRSGQRACLVGAVALGASRDLFDERGKTYFSRWIYALAAPLRRPGHARATPPPPADQTVPQITSPLF